jgi:chromosomal replication initiation ATPase DnaA
MDILKWEPFTPLVERVAQEAPELVAGLHSLQEQMLPAEFEKYINSLISVRQGKDILLLITKKEMYRSIIESKFLPMIRSSFGVDRVRIISQPY